jgi:hypothetical protein
MLKGGIILVEDIKERGNVNLDGNKTYGSINVKGTRVIAKSINIKR